MKCFAAPRQTLHALRPRRMAFASLAFALLLGGAACSSHAASGPAAATGAPSASGAAIPTSGPMGSGSPNSRSTATASQPSKSPLPKGVSTVKLKDPLATAAVRQVSRDGEKPHPTITTTTRTQSFAKPVIFRDGLRLKVTKIAQATMSGHGPGVYPGRPTTTFTLAMTNDTKKTLDLGVVVVTVTYGSPARVAHHVYDKQSADFGGVVKPGDSTTAAYGFSIPASGRGDVTMTIDIDGNHHLAVFHGSVKR